MRPALLVLLVVTVRPAVASADEVLERRSYWDRHGTTILTEELVRTADGSVERRTRPGGTVDGIGMAQWSVEAGHRPFAPSRTADGTVLRWADSCVLLRPDATGTSHLPDDQEHEILAGVLAHWREATRACSYLRLELEAAAPGEVGFDRVNRVVYREDRWCRPGDPPICYDPTFIGLTTLFFVDAPDRPDHGTILDADIELNATDHAIAVCDGEPGGCTSDGDGARYDLASVLTHEVGHLLGLAHTCTSPGDPPGLDGDGQPLPPCAPEDALPPALREATMYPRIDPESITLVTIESDDVAGFCYLYPAAADPGRCAPSPPVIDAGPDDPTPPTDAGGCGCAGGGGPASGGSAAAAVALLALRARRRRRGRRDERPPGSA